MKIAVIDLTGTKVKDLTLKKEVFGVDVNKTLLNQAIRIYRGNQRQSSAQAKERGEIARTTKKVYRQKGTGNARHGSRRPNIYVGGGVAHGPKGDQNYNLKFPKKMRKAALKSALTQKANQKQIIVVDSWDSLKKPQTKIMATFIAKAIENPRKVTIIFEQDTKNAYLSARNLKSVKCTLDHNLTTFEVIAANTLILSEKSIKNIIERLTK
jgi:large subunit ribosomal protein L4